MRIRYLILLAVAAGLAFVPGAPVLVRFAGMTLLLWALPGWGYRRLALAGEPGGRLDDLAFAALAPWAVHGVLGPLVAPLGVSPLELTAGVAGIGIALALALGADRGRPEADLSATRGAGFERAVIVVAAILTAILWLAPAYLSLKSDTYAHVAAVRACIEEGRVFPLHEFYPPAQGTGADPRFGVGHSFYAVWAMLSGLTALEGWRLVAPLAFLAYCLGVGSLVREACDSAMGRGLAFLVFLAAYGGAAYDPLRVASYPMWLGLAMVWLALARLLRDSGDASWRTSLGAAVLVVGSGGLHVLAFLLGMGMILVGRMVAQRRRRRGWWTRAFFYGLLLGLPVMGMRFWIGYGNVNPIHQKPWQTMAWLPEWYSASPSFLLAWLWPLGILGLLLIPVLRRQASDRESVRWSTTLALLSIVLLVVPFLMTPAMKVLGFLPMRLTLTILFPLVIGQWIDGRGLGPLRPSALLGGFAIAVLSMVLLGQRVGRVWGEEREPMVASAPWKELIEHLDREVEADAVILSDPYTMLAIKAMAPQSIVAVPDGRSSPRDAESIERLRASWRAASPSIGGAETDSILAQYAVTHVVLNHLFSAPIVSYEHPVLPETVAGQTRKFVGNPDRFEVVWESRGLTLLKVKPEGSWNEDYLTPCVTPRPVEAPAVPLADGFVLVDPQLEPAGGSTWRLTGGLSWDGVGAPPFRHFVVRADLQPDSTPAWARPIGKPYRKALEKLEGEARRQRWTVYPGCPTYVLGPEVQLPFSMDLAVSPRLSAGQYRVSVQVSDFSVFTVLQLRDFFRDDDAYAGPAVGTVLVGGGATSPARGPS